MKKPFFEIDAEQFTLPVFETFPIEGYELPKNEETNKLFPYCCEFHSNVYEGAQEWFLKFPNCCKQHKLMESKWWYDKKNHEGIAEKIANQISYTEYHISKRIDIIDWYKDITDYIEYNVLSFGHPPIGLHLYLIGIKHFINETKLNIPKVKKQIILEFLKSYDSKPKNLNNTSKTDFNVLFETYQKWLKIFPFDISFFATLKSHFNRQFPIVSNIVETNKYTGYTKVQIHTKTSLIDVLLKLTNDLLTQINPYILYDKGLLNEPELIKLELILQEMKIDNDEGFLSQKKDEEQKYRDMLKKWFSRQKRFIDEITPLLKSIPSQPIKSRAEILKEFLIKYGFFELEKVKVLSDNSKSSLVESISENGLPYAIAMFDFLNFINHLSNKYFDAKYLLNREVSKWFESDKEGRAVKGNISSLLKNTGENTSRYTAYKHKESVIKDYELLK